MWGMASKISSVITVRLPNEVISALNEIAETEGVNRQEWLRQVILPAVEAQVDGQEVSAA